jgi:hypothetical protein
MRGALEETSLQEKEWEKDNKNTHTHLSIYKLFMSYKPQPIWEFLLE